MDWKGNKAQGACYGSYDPKVRACQDCKIAKFCKEPEPWDGALRIEDERPMEVGSEKTRNDSGSRRRSFRRR